MKITRFLVAVVLLWASWNVFVTVALGDVYHGKVVDEETGQPLEGASVTVIWYRTPVIQLERSLYFQSAQETVTDANGDFSLEVSPGIDWSPFTTIVKQHALIIYKPGYGPFAPNRMPKEFWEYDDLVAAFKKGVTIRLMKLKTKEVRRYTSLASLNIGRVPSDQIRNLIRAINMQSKMIGVQPYPESSQDGATR